MKVELYLGGEYIELTEDIDFTLNKVFDELSNPTLIINEYSKTIEIPCTAHNSLVLGNLFSLERLIVRGGEGRLGVYTDQTKKVDAKLYYNGELVLDGYAKLSECNFESFSINLYGEIGEVFSKLMRLTFHNTYPSEEPEYVIGDYIGEGRMLDASMVVDSYRSYQGSYRLDSSIGWKDMIGFSPYNDGLYEDFNSKSVLTVDEDGGVYSEVIKTFGSIYENKWSSVYVDGDGNKFITKAKGGESLIGDGLQWQEFYQQRSYYNRPYIYVNKLIQILKEKSKEVTDYRIMLDDDFFNVNNPYYRDLVYTLPSLPIEDEVERSNHYSISFPDSHNVNTYSTVSEVMSDPTVITIKSNSEDYSITEDDSSVQYKKYFNVGDLYREKVVMFKDLAFKIHIKNLDNVTEATEVIYGDFGNVTSTIVPTRYIKSFTTTSKECKNIKIKPYHYIKVRIGVYNESDEEIGGEDIYLCSDESSKVGLGSIPYNTQIVNIGESGELYAEDGRYACDFNVRLNSRLNLASFSGRYRIKLSVGTYIDSYYCSPYPYSNQTGWKWFSNTPKESYESYFSGGINGEAINLNAYDDYTKYMNLADDDNTDVVVGMCSTPIYRGEGRWYPTYSYTLSRDGNFNKQDANFTWWFCDAESGERVGNSAGQMWLKADTSKDVLVTISNGSRSNSIITLDALIPEDFNLFKWFISYCKMFGLVFKTDYIKKRIYVLTKNNYFKDYKIEDWSDKIDVNSDYKVSPVTFDTKYVTFNYDEIDKDAIYYGSYKKNYGYEYGSTKVRTNYDFNDDNTDLYEGLKSSLSSTENNRSWRNMYNLDDFSYSSKEDYILPCLYKKNDNKKTPIDTYGQYYFRCDNQSIGKYISVCDDFNYEINNDTYTYHNILNSSLSSWSGYTAWQNSFKNTTILPRLDIIDNSGSYGCLFNLPSVLYANYGLVNANPQESKFIYDGFWSKYIEERYNIQNKKLTAWFNLLPTDYLDFDFNHFVKIENNLFCVNKIIDYNLNSTGLTKCELIQVMDLNAYKDFNEIWTVNNSTTAVSDWSFDCTGGVYSFTVTDYTDMLDIECPSWLEWRIVGVSDHVYSVECSVGNNDTYHDRSGRVIIYSGGSELLNTKVEQVWCPYSVTVTWRYNNGEEDEVESVVAGTVISKPTDPEKSGYNFVWWSKDGEEYDFSAMVTESLVLEAEYDFVNSKLVGGLEIAKGNCVYDIDEDEWSFHSHQYDIITATQNVQNLMNHTGKVDLIGYGMSGYNGTDPTTVTTDANDYPSGSIVGTSYDIGIYNFTGWRMMTSTEIDYIFNSRTNASDLKATATVNGRKGIVIMPDDWQDIVEVDYVAGQYGTYEGNVWTIEQWNKLEEYGAIFLPNAGQRVGTWLSTEGRGIYHLADYHDFWTESNQYAGRLHMDDYADNAIIATYGMAYRLCKINS